MQRRLMILLSLQPIKCLKPLSLRLNLSNIFVLSMSTKLKVIGFLEI